ncbi:MAG: neutral/alkaline non-lysosomal ceramidase N-terminal domain-containing protein [Candidatus Hydrogenedens sp.]
MKKQSIFLNKVFIICFIFSLLLFYPFCTEALKAGAVKVEITPDLGVPLNGYGARLGKGARAVHDPLWAHVLYLADDETELFLVSLDLCVIDRELREKVIIMAPENFPSQNIIMTATHTHNGFGGMCKNYPIRFVSGRYIPELVERTARIISQALRDAKEKAQNAVLGYGSIQQNDLTCNRRYPVGPMDPQIGFIVIEDANGNEIAIIANMAGHPTSIGDEDFYSFSSDYPGYYYLEIEQLSSPGCVPFFLNGAEGNQTIQAPEQSSGWARTEKVGRILARRVYEAQKSVPLSDAKLKLTAKEIPLPISIATFFPEKVLFHSLQVNGLAISFFPGEVCVEYALQLREHALEAGFKAHFTVGLANDYLVYFVPKHLLFDKTYEAGAHFFGPQAEKWVLNTCLSLIGIEKPELQITPVDIPQIDKIGSISIINLSGTSYERGSARGQFSKEQIQKRFDELIQRPILEGRYLPEQGFFSFIPSSWINISSLILPAMAISIRPWAKKLHPEIVDELIGISDGAEMPFDKIWLLQNAINIQNAQSYNPLFDTPLCTAVAILGERAGAKDILIAHTVDWAINELPVIFRHKPVHGVNFIEIGFPWFDGTLCGMNQSGIVLSITRDASIKTNLSEDTPGPEFTMKHILSTCNTLESAVEEISKIIIPQAYHVLLAGKDNKGKWSALLFPSLKPEDTIAQDLSKQGILLGCGSIATASESTVKRYSNLIKKIEDERIISPEELKTIMTSSDNQDSSPSQIWNGNSRLSVIFEPTENKVWLSVRDNEGKPSEFISIESGI